MPPVTILTALADVTRCQIVELLRAGPQPVHALASKFDISRPAVSRHLRVLKEAGIISETRSGRENRYRLHPTRLRSLQTWLTPLTTRPATTKIGTAPATRVQAPARPTASSISQMGFDF
jgi:DNA-binding transcriptional ArsR family regulator